MKHFNFNYYIDFGTQLICFLLQNSLTSCHTNKLIIHLKNLIIMEIKCYKLYFESMYFQGCNYHNKMLYKNRKDGEQVVENLEDYLIKHYLNSNEMNRTILHCKHRNKNDIFNDKYEYTYTIIDKYEHTEIIRFGIEKYTIRIKEGV